MTAHKNRTKTLFFSVVIGALALGAVLPTPLSVVPQVRADEMILTAIPPKVELKGDPGQTLTATLKIRNDSTETKYFAVNVEDFVVVDKIGTPIPVKSSTNNRWALSSWISAPKEIPVDAGGMQILNITVKIPTTALPGGHYAMITYDPNPEAKPGDLKQTGNVISQRVGSLILVSVNGDVQEQANILSFSAPQFTEKGPVDFTGTVESVSGIHINPKGSITISDPLNLKVADIPLETGNIFPETARDFLATWKQTWGWGRYRADLNLTYGTKNSVISSSIYFWLFPIRLVIYSLTAIISILTVIILLNKRSKKHQEELEKEVQALKEELQHIEKQ